MNYNLINSFNLFTNSSILLDLDILVSLISGILVITTKNPIVSILYLIALFISIATYLCIKGLVFMGLLYILIYVGAITILFLFIIMLLNIKISELYAVNKGEDIPLGVILTTLFIFIIYVFIINPYNQNIYSYLIDNINYNSLSSFFYTEYSIFSVLFNLNNVSNYNNIDLNSILLNNIYVNNWDNNITNVIEIISIGNIFYSNYAILLLILGITLLLSMICAITICMQKKA